MMFKYSLSNSFFDFLTKKRFVQYKILHFLNDDVIDILSKSIKNMNTHNIFSKYNKTFSEINWLYILSKI
jgi:hypothetical protein